MIFRQQSRHSLKTAVKAGLYVVLIVLVAKGILMLENGPGDRITHLQDAVNERSASAVERLIAVGADLEERDARGATPLINACGTDQFRIAEMLLKAGANIYATDDYDMTAGRMLWISRVSPSSPEGAARARVLKSMEARGFPFPAPNRDVVAAAKRAGNWPPH